MHFGVRWVYRKQNGKVASYVPWESVKVGSYFFIHVRFTIILITVYNSFIEAS